jgi:hypothetical protein
VLLTMRTNEMGKRLIRATIAVSALAISLPAMAQPEWRGRGGERHGGGRPGTEEVQQRRAEPAPAQDRGRWQRDGGDGDRGGWRGQRSDRMNAAPAPAPVQAPQANRERRDWDGRGQWRQNDGQAQRQWQERQWQGRDPRRDNVDSNRAQNRDWRRDRQDDNRWQDRNRGYGVVTPDRWQNNDRSRWERNRWSDQRRWDRDWRRDNRFNWSYYRQHNRHIYRLPRYHAPYGWSYGYRPFSIGIYLSALLFSDAYWIDDPWTYRLPPAYGTLRWIRYYDDALLVDIRDGYVVDVIRNFFW